MAVALVQGRIRRQAIEISLAVRVPDPHAFAAHQHDIQRLVIVRPEAGFEVDQAMGCERHDSPRMQRSWIARMIPDRRIVPGIRRYRYTVGRPRHARPKSQEGFLIGAPTDVGAGTRGASMGPEALRVAHLQSMLESQGVEVLDRGNLQGPGNPGLPPVDGYRHLAEVVAWNRAVHDALRSELTASRLPILLGGDHCLAIGSISAVARHCSEQGRKLRVIWFDAHADSNTNVLTPSGNIHGMPVAVLCGFGPAGTRSASAARRRSWSPASSGRSGSAASTRAKSASCTRSASKCSTCATSTRWACGQTMQAALSGLDRNTHLHVSFDVDFLDPEIAPGVGTTVPGGPSYREVAALHGDDCRHRVARFGRRHGAQSGLRPAQQDGRSGRRPAGFAVRQEHAHAPARTHSRRTHKKFNKNNALPQRPRLARNSPGFGLTTYWAGIYNRGLFGPRPHIRAGWNSQTTVSGPPQGGPVFHASGNPAGAGQ